MHDLPTPRTVPPQPIHAALGPLLLQHQPYRISEPDRVVWRVRREEKQVALANDNVLGRVCERVDGFEEHGATVLVEEFGGLVDVEVCAGVGAADDHDGEVIVVDAVVVDGGLEKVGVFLEPVVMKV